MFEVTYQWKVDFAIVFSLIALIISFLRWYLDKRNKRKSKTLEVYEKVFDDAIYILLYPLKHKKELANDKEFTHSDPKFEKAVRNYLNSHVLAQLCFNHDEFYSEKIDSFIEKQKYLSKVAEAANKFRDEVSEIEFDLNIPNMSPIYYMDNEEIKKRIQSITFHVGKNLSIFSEEVQDHWSDTLTTNPKDVRDEYEKALEVCPNYFSHNPRDFNDPFFDLVSQIRDDYRKITRKKIESISSFIRYYKYRIFHPIEGYRIYKENKEFF